MESLDDKKHVQNSKKKQANKDHKLSSVIKFPEEEKKEPPKLILGEKVSIHEW